jgi:hypothetical protein
LNFHGRAFTQKGVCPHDYVNTFSKFKNTCLLSKNEFYSELNNFNISDEEYSHALKIWKEFDCQTLQDYLDLYLKIDILILAGVFECFRKQCHQDYGLDPLYYFTLARLAWDAMLKKTEVKIELLNDIDKYLFFENGKRGGISMIANR